MKAIIIPVKLFRNSKQRLAPYYSEDSRAALAAALCEDFFAVVAEAKAAGRIYVVSQETHALELAHRYGWETIHEARQTSESDSVDAASRICAVHGVTACLRLPIDIPLAEAADIAAILEGAEDAPSAILVPSHDGTGTNALLRAPPTLFPSHFGPGSFARHLDEAERAGARVKIIRNPRLAFDIDEIGDVHAIARRVRAGSHLAQWLADAGVSETGPSPPPG